MPGDCAPERFCARLKNNMDAGERMKNRNAIRRWLCAMLMLALLCAAFAPTAMAASYSAKINSSSSKIYKSPSSSSKVLCNGVKNLRVSITGYSGDWARITYKGYTGYIKCEYLTLSSRITAYTAKSTPVYKRASSSSGKLGTLSTGSTVYIVGMDDGYYAKITSTSSLKKGDILCFDTDGDGVCDHTAIYLGSGSFIEASQNAGKVQTNGMSSWYKAHFLWARRPA